MANTTIKAVHFHKINDADLLEFANSMPNFSGWVKLKLAEAMGKTSPKPGIDPEELRALVEQIIEERLPQKPEEPSPSVSEVSGIADEVGSMF
jgi:hypothetical protein